MQDYANTLPRIAQSVQEAANGLVDDSRLNTMVANVQDKCRSLKPGVMLYGFYNAGKSTLLNALLEREIAAVSDVPETKVITEYDYRGYRLFDTPGIDAPIEHEHLSREHLAKVEVVIFVISASACFEEQASYEELVSLAQSKKLLVVLNAKEDYDDNAKMKIYETVSARLQKLLPDTFMQIPLIFLNAASALRGRLEGKNLLLKKSNLRQLEENIAEVMAKTTMLDAVRSTAAMISPVIVQAEQALQERVAATKTARLDHLQSTGRADQRLTQLRANGSQLIAQECQNAIQSLRQGIDPQVGVDDALAQSIIVECNDTITIGLQKLQDEFISETRHDLEIALRSNNDGLPTNLAAGVASSADGSAAPQSEVLSNLLRGIDKNSLAKGGFALAKTAGDAANNCSGWLKEILIKFGKAGKFIGKCAGPLAIVIQGVVSIFDITRGYQEDQAAYDQRVANINAINQHLESIQRTIKNEFNQAWQRCCDDFRTQVEHIMATLKNQDTDQERDLRNRLDILAAAKAELAEL